MTEIRFFRSTLFKYIAIAVLPLAVLLFQPAASFTVLTFGVRALLETRPVDPRDFLRGDYVTLDYVIADVPDELFSQEDAGEIWGDDRRSPVYVTLALDDKGIASVSGASFSRPAAGLYIQGRRNWRGMDYGLGVYYVPEGTGLELENALREPNVKVLADVRILRGRGVIKKLEIVK
ncbi:MAG: GDYXXLXY domain-containing protein [Synergistaceae bacterium]|jgi:uncharacterized membrane-anchored protein|nr:GDYXXLXY domain-containing protein [Synergistaceae bacterium]